MDMSSYLKLPDVALRLGVSEKTARRYIKSGALPSIFVGNAYRVHPDELDAFVERTSVEHGVLEGPDPSKAEASLSPAEESPEQRRSKAGLWITTLNEHADLCEHVLERGGYDLKTIARLEADTLQIYGTYNYTVRRLVLEWCLPDQLEALGQAEERMKAARTAVGEAFQNRRAQAQRDAEPNSDDVVRLEDERQKRAAQFSNFEEAGTGT
jgi:excisionase family DNA binding protein